VSLELSHRFFGRIIVNNNRQLMSVPDLKNKKDHAFIIFFRHIDGRTAIVPDHKGDDFGRRISNKILHEPFSTFLLKRLNFYVGLKKILRNLAYPTEARKNRIKRRF
jgi:hypothetical protein